MKEKKDKETKEETVKPEEEPHLSPVTSIHENEANIESLSRDDLMNNDDTGGSDSMDKATFDAVNNSLYQ